MKSSLASLFDAASQVKLFRFPVQYLLVENEFSVENDGQATTFVLQVSIKR